MLCFTLPFAHEREVQDLVPEERLLGSVMSIIDISCHIPWSFGSAPWV